MKREELEQKICDLEDLYALETGLHVYDKGEYTEWLEEKYLSLSPAAGEQAQRCPVCGGNGLVPNGFYNTVTGIMSTTSITPETCRSCNGTGIVYPPPHPSPTAEEFLVKRNYDPTLAYPHLLVVQLMEEYASKPTVAERGVEDRMGINETVTSEEYRKARNKIRGDK